MMDGKIGFSEESQSLHLESESPIAHASNSNPNLNLSEQKLLSQTNFDELYMYQRPHRTTWRDKHKTFWNQLECKHMLSLFPILKWMRNYSWNEDLLHDVISGFTVAIMHIPQGMAYSMLGGVPPIVGIYMAFFPVLIYILMGTSRHISMGTFAVVCMMTGKVVSEYSPQSTSRDDHAMLNDTIIEKLQMTAQEGYNPIQVATCVCFVVGLWQFFLGLFKLGGLSVLLSDTLVSGFTTGAAIHVATSQVKHLFGVKVTYFSGPLKVIYTYVDLLKKIKTTNMIALALCLPVIFIIAIYNELIKPAIGKKLPVPVPIELIVIVLGTLVSSYGNLKADYNVTTVGDIPTGFPKPSAPPFNLLLNVAVDGLIIAIVSFSINMSMASLFARKCKYKVNGNQELLASGASNMFGSFFSCLPFAASLSRSLIQKSTGGRTQMASLVSCCFLLFVLLWFGPFFEPLPQCVLAAIVVVSLKGMFVQVMDLKAIWHHSTADGLVWLITFISVVIIDIDIGLGIGIFLSVVTVMLLGQKIKIIQLGNIPGMDIYLDISHYQAALEVPRTAILQIAGGIHFANSEYVKSKLCSIIYNKMESNGNKIAFVILDMSCIAFLDPAAVKTLLSIRQDFKERSIDMYLAYCSVSIREKLLLMDFFQEFPENHVFPFTHSAVLHLRHHHGL